MLLPLLGERAGSCPAIASWRRRMRASLGTTDFPRPSAALAPARQSGGCAGSGRWFLYSYHVYTTLVCNLRTSCLIKLPTRCRAMYTLAVFTFKASATRLTGHCLKKHRS